MRTWITGLALAGAALATVPAAAGHTLATPTKYRFSFTLAEKPDYVKAFPAVRVTGTGSGSFSIKHRQIDRDGTVFWDLVSPKGTISLSAGGHVFVTATIVGGHFGTETATGGLARNVRFQLRITSSTRFQCAAPAATLDMQDLPQVQGNEDGMGFRACGSDIQWTGKPPALVAKITPV